MRIKLKLSDHAWEHLSTLAYSLGWIRQLNTVNVPGNNTRNIRTFFVAISTLVYEDTRPEQFTGTCIWQEGELAIPRIVSLSRSTVLVLAALATNYRVPPRWYAMRVLNEQLPPDLSDAEYANVLVDERTTMVSLASAALEAIGCRYLTPFRFPPAPDDLFKYALPKTTNARGKVAQQIARQMGY